MTQTRITEDRRQKIPQLIAEMQLRQEEFALISQDVAVPHDVLETRMSLQNKVRDLNNKLNTQLEWFLQKAVDTDELIDVKYDVKTGKIIVSSDDEFVKRKLQQKGATINDDGKIIYDNIQVITDLIPPERSLSPGVSKKAMSPPLDHNKTPKSDQEKLNAIEQQHQCKIIRQPNGAIEIEFKEPNAGNNFLNKLNKKFEDDLFSPLTLGYKDRKVDGIGTQDMSQTHTPRILILGMDGIDVDKIINAFGDEALEKQKSVSGHLKSADLKKAFDKSEDLLHETPEPQTIKPEYVDLKHVSEEGIVPTRAVDRAALVLEQKLEQYKGIEERQNLSADVHEVVKLAQQANLNLSLT